jgi:hypothetical protein
MSSALCLEGAMRRFEGINARRDRIRVGSCEIWSRVKEIGAIESQLV